MQDLECGIGECRDDGSGCEPHDEATVALWNGVVENLSNDEIIREKYRGIRPAPGYPACPDHVEKQTIWKLLGVEACTGIQLTESFAMYPAAAVSGFYFAHPAARYFAIGSIDRDQVEDYAARTGRPIEEVERWLQQQLTYVPA